MKRVEGGLCKRASSPKALRSAGGLPVCAYVPHRCVTIDRLHNWTAGYVQRTFPQDAPRSRSAVISEAYGKRIISYLKGNSEDDKHFRHLVKRSGFRLLDFPEAGTRDAVVVAVKEDKEVGYFTILKLM